MQSELDWLAFRYITGELPDAERQSFEQRLESELLAGDLTASEALVRAEQLLETTRLAARELTPIDMAQPVAWPSGNVLAERVDERRVAGRVVVSVAVSSVALSSAGVVPGSPVVRWNRRGAAASSARVLCVMALLVLASLTAALLYEKQGDVRFARHEGQAAGHSAALLAAWKETAPVPVLMSWSDADLVEADAPEYSLEAEDVAAAGEDRTEDHTEDVVLGDRNELRIPGWLLAAISEEQSGQELGPQEN